MSKPDPPPKPKSDKSVIHEYIDPIGDYSQKILFRYFERIFSLGAIRSFLVGFLATYILVNASIQLSLSEFQFGLSSDPDFVSVILSLCIPIILFSFVIIKERDQSNRVIERRVNTSKAWNNYLQHIQPKIKTARERAQLSTMILTKEINSEDLRDVLIKTYGVDLKNVVEDVAIMKEDFEPLKKLAQQARKKKRSTNK